MLEKRFQQFRDSIKPEEFNNIAFLKQKAKDFEESDAELSARILLRVKNLTIQKENQSPLRKFISAKLPTNVKKLIKQAFNLVKDLNQVK